MQRVWLNVLFVILVMPGILLGGPAYRTDRILVKPKPGRSLSALHARQGNHVMAAALGSISDSNVEVLEVKPGQVESMISAYLQSGDVEFAEPDYILHASLGPNDPKYASGDLWAYHNTGQRGGLAGVDIGAEEAWAVINSASNVVVAIIDTGIRYTHEDLVANLWTNSGEVADNGRDDDSDGVIDDVYGYNAITGSGDPWDDAGHGTHVAGIIGAVGNNGKGVVGVAWHVQLMACKFMDARGEGATSDAIRCIDFARKHGAHIINASWGAPGYSLALRTAIGRARTAGIIFVTAAGNEIQDLDTAPSYPASYAMDNIVSVAATTRRDELADYSNWGAKSVTLAAPGSEIVSTWYNSDRSYTTESGTSMSAPFVSGALALAKAYFPKDTYKDLIARLVAGVDVVPSLKGKCVTGGRLNLRKTLSIPLPPKGAHLTAAANTQTGVTQFNLQGDPNSQYIIEVSSDLLTWTELVTVDTSFDGTLNFSDIASGSSGQRFYRARLVPPQ